MQDINKYIVSFYMIVFLSIRLPKVPLWELSLDWCWCLFECVLRIFFTGIQTLLLLLRLVRVHQPLSLALRPTFEKAHQLVEPVLDHHAAYTGR